MTPDIGKRILVTGAAGFVGSHLVRRLLQRGGDIHAVIRKGTDTWRISDMLGEITVHEADLADQQKIVSILEVVKPNGIYHLAAVNQAFGAVPSLDELIDINIRASMRLMLEAQKYRYDFFVNTSTFVEVGAKSYPLKEDDRLEPTELYGISRIPALQYAQLLGRSTAKPIVTIRVFTPYGPTIQRGKLVHNVISNALRNAEIRLTRPSVTRDLVYIDDLVDIYIAAAENAVTYPGQIFNGGSGKATTLQDLVELVVRKTGATGGVAWSGSEISYDRGCWEADISNLRKKLHWQPRFSLEKGITDTIAWFKANEAYWR